MDAFRIFKLIFVINLALCFIGGFQSLIFPDYAGALHLGVSGNPNMVNNIENIQPPDASSAGSSLFPFLGWTTGIIHIIFSFLTGNYGIWQSLGIPYPFDMILAGISAFANVAVILSIISRINI